MSTKESRKLTIGDRLVLLSILPQEGDYVTLKIMRKLRETLAPSDMNISVPIKRLFWNQELNDKAKEIWFGKKAKDIIIESLEKLANEKKLREDDGTMNLYEMFIDTDEEED
jgi:hypothetical protein